MQLYGAAIAAIPTKTDPRVMDITITPIAVKDKRRTKFEIEAGADKHQVNFGNTREAVDFFIQMVDLIDRLVRQQEKNLKKAKLPYRPVSLWIGQNSQNPVRHSLIAASIFGPFSFYSTHRPSLSQLWHEMTGTYQAVAKDPKYHNYTIRVGATEVEKQFARAKGHVFAHAHAADTCLSRLFESAATAMRSEIVEKMKSKMMVWKWVYFALRDGENFSRFQKAARKLAKLMEKTTLNWGSYGKSIGDKLYFDQINNFNEQLKALKVLFENGDQVAKTEIESIAYEIGLIYGNKVNKNPHIFAVDILSEDKRRDKKFQNENPIDFFYDWHPDFRREFYRGYKETYNNKFYRHIKVPTDRHKPFFSDPCADGVCAQFEIAAGERKPEDVFDKPKWREALAGVAHQVANLQVHPGWRR